MAEFTGTVTEPGLYGGIPEALYHADPIPGGSLSVTASRLLLPPSCPALFKHARDHGGYHSKAMDTGTVVHSLVLGTSPAHVVIDAENWRKDADKAKRDNAIAAGLIPLLPHQLAEAEKIAAAVKAHDIAGGLFAQGDAETSGFWRDPETGIWLRMRMDWMTHFGAPIIVDFKTTADVSPDHFAKSVADFGYHRQDPWYRDGLAAALKCDPDDIDFVFVAVATTEPHLVMVYRLDDEAVALGREQNKITREKYRDCTEAEADSRPDAWPAWDAGIADLSLRYYDARTIERQINEWYG